VKSVVIIGIVIAAIIIGGSAYYVSSLPEEVKIEQDVDVKPEGKQYILELSDSVSMSGE
jgi:hypothetical protein